MVLMRSSVKGVGLWVLLALILSGWVLRTESASSGGTVSADLTTQVKVAFSGLRLNRTTQTYDTVATLTNTSATVPILAPLELRLTAITPASVTLDNPTGTTSSGFPYVAIPLPTGILAPGATVTNVALRFRNSSNVQFTFTHQVIGMLAASNKPPVANAGPDQSARVGTPVTLDGSASTDPDGDALGYLWTLPTVPAGSVATLAASTTVHPTLTLDKPGTYAARLVVNDGQADSAPDTVTISTSNTPPLAKAGADQRAPVGATVTLDGSASSDVDGNLLTYRWTLPTRPDGSAATLANPATVKPTLTLDKAGTYTVQLIVNDGTVDSAPASVTISTANTQPVANAGPDQSVAVGATVRLTGSGSSDADGDALSYQWALTTQPVGSAATLANPTTVNPSFTVDKAGDYVVQLIVNDGKTPSNPDTVRISTENSKPVANAGPDQAAVTGQTVTLNGAGSRDADGDPLTYQWALTTRPPQSQAVVQNATGVQATFVPDLVGQYIAQLIVNDSFVSSAPDTATVTVTAPTPTNHAPQITSSPVTKATVSQLYNYDVNAADADGDTLTYVLNTAPASMSINASSGLIAWTPTAAGDASVGVEVRDGKGGNATQSFTIQVTAPVGPPLPPDPATVAPPINRTVATTNYAATHFLYTGSNPIQTGVASGTINPVRSAVIRGKVLDKNNAPLSGVTMTVLNHPEFGQTLSRADGMFDLAVNGGGLLTVNYQRAGYLPAQRQVNAPWQDFTSAPDVVLLTADPQVNTINLTASTLQVARGSVVSDGSGQRQATVLIPPGTQAQVYNADGSTRTVTSLTLRATEYTVGANGPAAMPGPLPPTSAYTYAVALNTDEGTIKKDGKDVLFNQPVPFYVDNFLNMPVGIAVPVGYYDPAKSAWIPANDGRVIKVLRITNGLAELDTTGNGTADNGATLGVTDAERQQLATLYAAGKTVWRVPLTHLSTYDCNYGVVPVSGATAPQLPPPPSDATQKLDDPTTVCGSIIGCENKTLGEMIRVTGTPFSLYYASDRVPGWTTTNTLTIPLSRATVPSALKRIDLEITIAGRTIQQTFPATANQSTTFVWDGKDAYGQPVQGQQTATLRIGYVYDGFYALPPYLASNFGAASGQRIPGNIPARQGITLWQTQQATVGSFDARAQNLGGWTLNAHHTYAPGGKTLYQGDGSRRSAQEQWDNIITTVAGNSDTNNNIIRDGGPATQQSLTLHDIAVAPDGSLLIAEMASIRRVGPDGIITTIAGNQASLGNPHDIAVAPDGSILFTDQDNYRIRRVSPDGIITTIAGNGILGFSGDGGPATQASLGDPSGIAVAPDGSVLIAAFLNTSTGASNRIRRVGPDGIITTFAGNGRAGAGGDGGPATQASLGFPSGIAMAPDGSLLIADMGRIRRVGPDGIITTIAGNGLPGFSGDGGPATQAQLQRVRMAVAPDGSVLIADFDNNRIRRVGSDGIITTFAGNGLPGYSGDGGPATQAQLENPYCVAVAPDGSVLTGDLRNHKVRKVSPALPGFNTGNIGIASEDGRQLYRFDGNGRHLSTLDTLTNTVLYRFAYDSAGRLSTITDANGNITTVERDGNGNPTAIVAPFGQRTALTVDGNGWLARATNPAGEAYAMAYTADGLLTGFTDPLGHTTTMTYDALGRLVKDSDPAGGSQTLARTDLSNGYTVTRATALNRTTTYRVEDLSTGDQRRSVTAPDGATTTTLTQTDGTVKTTAPDGSVTQTLQGPDPRFGMQAPIPKSQTVTSGGLTSTLTTAVTAALSDTNNPLSLTTLTANVTLNGRAAASVYNAATRKTTTTSAAGRVSYSVLDAQGRMSETGITGLDAVHYSYDPRGRLSSVTQGSRTTRLSYDAGGFLSNATDPLGRVTTFANDAVGRVLTQTLPDARQIGFAYDAGSNLTALTPPGQPAHGFSYTPVNLTAAYRPPTVPGGGDTLYGYNLDRQPTQITRPDGGVITSAYDAGGRLSTLTTPTGVYSYSYTAAGQISGITAPGNLALAYGYNQALLTGVTWSGTVAGQVGFAYDNDFRVTAITVNGSTPIAYQYDPDSLLTGAGSLALTRNSQNGLLTGTTLDKVSDSDSYDSFGEITGYTANYNAATSLLTVQYTYDQGGRITQKVETVAGGAAVTSSYGYDALGQLIEVKRNGATVARYSYDANGNRLSFTGSGTVNGTYDAQDRLLTYGTATYTYTANGELKTKTSGGQTTTYDYDALGNLRGVTLPGGTPIAYLIDGQNRRIGKKINGALVQGFLYQGQLQPIAELDATGAVVSRFVYAGRANVPHYLIKGGQTYRILTDHLGSPRLVVNASTGVIIQQMEYDEFGRVLTDSNPGFQPFGFAGGLYERDTGLVRFGARDYDAVTGRWMVKDPILFRGKGTNLYAYVFNEPVNHADSLGLLESLDDPRYPPPVHPHVVGRYGSIVPPGGETGRFIEDQVAYGYKFGEAHDAFVDLFPRELDLIVNIPSMPLVYSAVVLVNSFCPISPSEASKYPNGLRDPVKESPSTPRVPLIEIRF
ncbi:MAG: hypothetical protein IPL99_17140 [Candidatus Competibacteraceae bacterium]|nr:hypothetical protein [Candidatus Competibacteraceae bacterium]